MRRRAAAVATEARPPVSVDLRTLRHVYDTPEGALTVLDDVDLHVAPGETVAVTGSSGSGKTTLLSLLGGLERVQYGSVRVGGVDVSALGGNGLAAYRRTTVGFVFQDFGLLGQLSALENVELALSFSRGPGTRRRARARALLDSVGLGHRLGHRPHALSGGESQRVAIARALANDPRLVLADEPTGNLDAQATEVVLDVLATLPRERGCTLVLVTHDPIVAARADRVVALRAGHMVLA